MCNDPTRERQTKLKFIIQEWTELFSAINILDFNIVLLHHILLAKIIIINVDSFPKIKFNKYMPQEWILTAEDPIFRQRNSV